MWAALEDQRVHIDNLTVLPVQFFADAQVSSPGQRLRLAVLESALNDLLLCLKFRSSRRAQHLAAKAWGWIDEGNSALLSFDDTCDHLGLNPETVREGMRRTLEKKGMIIPLRRSNS